MLKIVKTTDGKYYRVRPEDELNEQEVTEAVAEASANLDALKAIAPADQPTPAIAEAQGNADAPVAPAEPVPPAAPADPPVAPPVAPPVDQPTAPADPAAVTLS